MACLKEVALPPVQLEVKPWRASRSWRGFDIAERLLSRRTASSKAPSKNAPSTSVSALVPTLFGEKVGTLSSYPSISMLVSFAGL